MLRFLFENDAHFGDNNKALCNEEEYRGMLEYNGLEPLEYNPEYGIKFNKSLFAVLDYESIENSMDSDLIGLPNGLYTMLSAGESTLLVKTNIVPNDLLPFMQDYYLDFRDCMVGVFVEFPTSFEE